MTVQKFAEQIKVLTVERSRIKHQNRNIRKDMLYIIQNLMRPHKGINFSDTGQQKYISLLMWFICHFFDKNTPKITFYLYNFVR